MVDAGVLVREYLLAQSTVTALLGTNANGSIYVAYDLPENFDPALGPGIQIFRSGGQSHVEIKPLVDARLTVRAWADVEQYTAAANLYASINDVLHGLCGFNVTDGTIVRALEVDGPLEMTDPDTGWVSMYAFYKVMATPLSAPTPSVYIPQFYEADGPPSTLHNNDDTYYDELTGNLYEQVAGAWVQIGNIPVGGGGDEMPSSKFHLVAASGTNPHVVKAGPGVLTGWFMSNEAGYAVYVKLYDKATDPDVGVDVPVQTIQVQAGQPVPFPFGSGITYSNGIAIAITEGMADGNAVGVAAGDCAVDLFYQ